MENINDLNFRQVFPGYIIGFGLESVETLAEADEEARGLDQFTLIEVRFEVGTRVITLRREEFRVKVI